LPLQAFYPKLQVAFDADKPVDLAWAFAADVDSSLYDESIRFFHAISENKQLEQIIDRYHGHAHLRDATALDTSLRLR
jgi:membrane-bound lytic murein transglycosylase F